MATISIEKIPADQGMRQVLDMVKREHIAQQMEGSPKNNYLLVGFGANNTIYNGKPYQYSTKQVEELQRIITEVGTTLMHTQILQEPQSEQDYPMCYGDDMVSKFRVLGKVIKLPYLFVNVLGKTIGYQKLHLSMKNEVKYYNRFTDEELSMLNDGIRTIALKLCSIQLTVEN